MIAKAFCRRTTTILRDHGRQSPGAPAAPPAAALAATPVPLTAHATAPPHPQLMLQGEPGSAWPVWRWVVAEVVGGGGVRWWWGFGGGGWWGVRRGWWRAARRGWPAAWARARRRACRGMGG